MADESTNNEYRNAFINGTLLGAGGYGLVTAIKKIQDTRRMRRNLAKLEKLTQDELMKDDISISGDFFKDRYVPLKKKAEVGPGGVKEDKGLQGLPILATMAVGAGIGYPTVGIVHELLKRRRAPQTPEFAVNYRKAREKEFERAAKLLRAVTDAPTWKDVAALEKQSGVMEKDAFGFSDIGHAIASGAKGLWDTGKAIGKGVARIGKNTVATTDAVKGAAESAGDVVDSVKEKVEEVGDNIIKNNDELIRPVSDFARNMNNYGYPLLASVAILGGGYLANKALNKILYGIRTKKKEDAVENAAIAAWLAQRKELGEPGKVLNAYVEADDDLERKELNRLLEAYEARYKS